MERLKPSQIRDLVTNQKIPVEQGVQMWNNIRESNVIGVFVSDRDHMHFVERREYEEQIRHKVAKPVIAVVGVVDGVLEAVAFGTSELAETVVFAISRTIHRLQQGWHRGKN